MSLPPECSGKVFLGAGCTSTCNLEELVELAEAALREAGIVPAAVTGVATLDTRGGTVIAQLAARFGVPLQLFTAARLEIETPRLASPSQAVFTRTGCHSVCEGAALAAAGKAGRLVLAKRKTANATVAIAASPDQA